MLQVGDKLMALNFDEVGTSFIDPRTWSSASFSNPAIVETEIISISSRVTDKMYLVNGDLYSPTHWIFTRKDNVYKFILSGSIDNTYEVYKIGRAHV